MCGPHLQDQCVQDILILTWCLRCAASVYPSIYIVQDIYKLGSGCVWERVAICHRWCRSSYVCIWTGKLYLRWWLFHNASSIICGIYLFWGPGLLTLHARCTLLSEIDLRAWWLPVGRDQSVHMRVVFICVLFHLLFYRCKAIDKLSSPLGDILAAAHPKWLCILFLFIFL